MTRLLESPTLLLDVRDSLLLGITLRDLLERGYFDGLGDADRARMVAMSADMVALAERVRTAAGNGQLSNALDSSGQSGLMTYQAVARWLEVGERTVRRLVADGRLPVVCIGRARRVRLVDLEAFVEAS